MKIFSGTSSTNCAVSAPAALLTSTYLPTNTMNNCFPIPEESITIKTRWLATDTQLIKRISRKGLLYKNFHTTNHSNCIHITGLYFCFVWIIGNAAITLGVSVTVIIYTCFCLC